MREIPKWKKRVARRTPTYDSLDGMLVQAMRRQGMIYGIVDGELYQIWPGGRNICWGRVEMRTGAERRV